MRNIIVLGGGMVGSAMAIDLSSSHEVTLADISQSALQKAKLKCSKLQTIQLDVAQAGGLQSALQPFDLVICAVPGFMGFNTLKSIIEAGKNCIDISFFPENASALNELAIEKGVTAIVDCGVAPGMDNIILGYYNELLDISDFECLVGGLPKARKWPFNYKAPFSPVDVIEEYTRPARFVENGHLVVRDALSDLEHVEFKQVGTLESFNSDGLRSLIETMPHIQNMKEKTLRYPGHAEAISILKSAGFFDTNPLMHNNSSFVPLEVTSRILFREWKLEEQEEEITVMRVSIRGRDKDGMQKSIVYELYDAYDAETNTSSMARTTGYTATAAATLFLEGLFQHKGVFPPELLGKHENCFRFVLQYLKERGVHYDVKTVTHA
jgi:saccharopine dehydrogenase-like NADP-dependent oxidoreductase